MKWQLCISYDQFYPSMNAISFPERGKEEVGLAMAMTVTMVDCGRCIRQQNGLLGSQICVNRFGTSHSVWPEGISIPVNKWRSNGVRALAAVVEKEKTETPYVPRLKSAYLDKVVPVLYDEFKYTNLLRVPRVEKIVVNCGIGEAAQNAKALESAIRDLSLVTGQRPVKTRAKKSIAGFKLREGVPVGLAVTLRGNIMYSFLDRLINLGLPRTRDFQGVNPNSFDGHGNYNIGIREQNVFPEIKFESMDKPRGMDICISTSAKSDNEAQKLLSLMGMPFREGITAVATARKKRKSNYKGEKGGKGRKKK